MQGALLVTTKDYGRISNPYGSALLISENNDGYYELTIPLKSIPSPFGDEETFEYNILTEKTKGLTKGKQDLSAVTTDIFATKENCYRLDQIKDKVYSFMVAFGNGMGYTFNGELSYRLNDVDNGDNLTGTLIITPSSIGETVYDVRPFIRQTLTFAGTIPATVEMSSTTTPTTIECKVTETPSATVAVEVVGDGASNYAVTWTNGSLSITAKAGITAPAYALAYVTASSTEVMSTDSTAKKYAPYTLIIDLSYEA